MVFEHPVQMIMAAEHYHVFDDRFGRSLLHLHASPWRSDWSGTFDTALVEHEAVDLENYQFFFPDVFIDTRLRMGLCSCGTLFVREIA